MAYRRRLTLLVLAAAALSVGCNHDALPGSPGDGGALLDLLVSGGEDLSGALFGAKVGPRVSLNGAVDLAPTLTAHYLPLDCCEAVSLGFKSATIATPVAVMWRYQGGLAPADVTLDLAALPMAWSVWAAAGCDDPWASSCVPAEIVREGFTGSMTVSHDGAGAPITTLCLSYAEDPTAPRTVLHQLHLWAPPVAAR